MSYPTPPDSIFCANDIMAIAALNVVTREYGLIPGTDISIVGFDNIEMSRWPLIGLTTYLQPIEKMVQRTVNIIREQLKDSVTPSIQEILPGQLIIRHSARRPIVGLEIVSDDTLWQPIK